jgi:hypothetical protein
MSFRKVFYVLGFEKGLQCLKIEKCSMRYTFENLFEKCFERN